MHRISATAAMFALIVAAPLRAQDAAADTTPRTSLQKGAWSLSFDVPSYGGGAGGGAFGGWKMVGERTNLGLLVRIHANDRDDSTEESETDQRSSSLAVGLHARRYAPTIRDVTPFLAAGIEGYTGRSTQRHNDASVTGRGYGASAQAGVGVEWFPVRRVSLAGHTGAEVRIYTSSSEVDTDNGPRENDQSALDFATFTSRLSLQIYF
ncbi:MAG TPA: outer membrane beta-barrel protein [Longimicrobium sp.]|nr:outer membrane beta-barrel protein [Longimicrobium sp.]